MLNSNKIRTKFVKHVLQLPLYTLNLSKLHYHNMQCCKLCETVIIVGDMVAFHVIQTFERIVLCFRLLYAIVLTSDIYDACACMCVCV